MRTIRTPTTRDRFLEILERHGNVSNAALAADIRRSALYQWKAADPEFSNQWEAALQLGLAALEDAAMEFAHAGSEKLIMFLLASRMPEKYGNRQTIDVNQTHNVNIRRMPIDQLRAELADLIRLAAEPTLITFPKK